MQKSIALKEAAWFFGLTLGSVYLIFWGPLALFQIPTISFVRSTQGPVWAIILFLLGGFTPSVTAVYLTWKNEGGMGLRRMGRRALQFKIGWRWYAAMILLVGVTAAGQLLIQRLMGFSFDYSLFLAQLGSFVPLILIGPISEEFGWRGYALDRLQTRWSPAVSAGIIGLFWAFWHLPLFLMIGTSQHELAIPFFGFLVGTIAQSVLFAWLHNHTGASIWTAVFYHWIYTYAAQVVASGVTRSPLFNWLEYVPLILAAAVILAVWKTGRTAPVQPA